MAEMKDIYTVMLKASLDYILEDIEEAKLFEMVSIIAKLAEQSAYARREKKLREGQHAEQERYRNINALSQKIPMPTQQLGLTEAQIGERRG